MIPFIGRRVLQGLISVVGASILIFVIAMQLRLPYLGFWLQG